MQKQLEDAFTTTTANWQEGASVSEMKYIGNYFLTAKKPENSLNNKIYLVYKMTVTEEMTDAKSKEDVSEETEFYYYIAFSNLMNIPGDGLFVDLTSYERTNNSFNVQRDVVKSTGWWETKYSFRYTGFQTLDEIYKIAVVKNIENYNCETNISE